MALRFQSMVAYYGVLLPFEERGPRRQDGDRTIVERYARENNGHIIEHYREEGQTRRSTRPQMAKALQRAKDASALLILARFHPLARDPVFLKLLWESKVEFVACDNEYATRTTLPLLASIVAKESRQLAVRTKAALKRRKRLHGPHGTPDNLTHEARLRGGESTKRLHSTSLNDQLQAELLRLRAEGKSLRRIAAILSDQGHKTKTDRPWSHSLVKRLLERCEKLERDRKVNRAKRLENTTAR